MAPVVDVFPPTRHQELVLAAARVDHPVVRQNFGKVSCDLLGKRLAANPIECVSHQMEKGRCRRDTQGRVLRTICSRQKKRGCPVVQGRRGRTPGPEDTARENECRVLTQCLRNGNRSALQGVGSGAILRERNHLRHPKKNLELLRWAARRGSAAA
eukprot:CAMPEP_0113954432 /NCGR_PEP_ID=MMETSP0011_2-20120614/537_1 /TAXON_ID=101924 /ORGANISM="Rhodosorus marinus" /LENGTH=155 /DNA_ID=CAMNT_0000963535 /DNA_START=482 /DNA_END=949 /DNA_ORIENTATION=- /assembly_acc=CAM_ASM_000156